MHIMFIFGASLMILHLVIAGHQYKEGYKVKYILPFTQLILGILFVPLSFLFSNLVQIILASMGVTMIITSLIMIPLTTLIFQNQLKRNKSHIRNL